MLSVQWFKTFYNLEIYVLWLIVDFLVLWSKIKMTENVTLWKSG